jgi:hypothetical protein
VLYAALLLSSSRPVSQSIVEVVGFGADAMGLELVLERQQVKSGREPDDKDHC